MPLFRPYLSLSLSLSLLLRLLFNLSQHRLNRQSIGAAPQGFPSSYLLPCLLDTFLAIPLVALSACASASAPNQPLPYHLVDSGSPLVSYFIVSLHSQSLFSLWLILILPSSPSSFLPNLFPSLSIFSLPYPLHFFLHSHLCLPTLHCIFPLFYTILFSVYLCLRTCLFRYCSLSPIPPPPSIAQNANGVLMRSHIWSSAASVVSTFARFSFFIIFRFISIFS